MAESAPHDIQPYMFDPEYHSGESEHDSEDSRSSDSDLAEDGRADQPAHHWHWCSCTKCIPMQRHRECVCCHEWAEVLGGKLDTLDRIVDHHDFFTVCLQAKTLCTAFMIIHFMTYKRMSGTAPETLTNRSMIFCYFFLNTE